MYIPLVHYHPQFFCSPGEGNICYFPLRVSSPGSKNLKVGRIDFDSPDNHTHLTISGAEYYIYSGVAFSDDEAWFAGFKIENSGESHQMFRYNFTTDTFIWAKNSPAISKYQ